MCLNKEVWLDELFPIIEQQLDSGGSASFTIHGTSMLPFLKDRRDGIKIVKPKSNIKKYDIIFYRRSNGDFVLHRVVGVTKSGYICRGDNQVDNESVDDANIIAVATEYLRNEKWKPMGSSSQKIYSFIWVNTMFLRKVKRKIFSMIKK